MRKYNGVFFNFLVSNSLLQKDKDFKLKKCLEKLLKKFKNLKKKSHQEAKEVGDVHWKTLNENSKDSTKIQTHFSIFFISTFLFFCQIEDPIKIEEFFNTRLIIKNQKKKFIFN
jgi:hypothetical protein